MSLGYSGLVPDSFLDTMSKQILQVEAETSLVWDQAIPVGTPWSVNQVNLGQVDQDIDV